MCALCIHQSIISSKNSRTKIQVSDILMQENCTIKMPVCVQSTLTMVVHRVNIFEHSMRRVSVRKGKDVKLYRLVNRNPKMQISLCANSISMRI